MNARTSARLLLLDPSDRLLLMSAIDGLVSDPEGGRRPGELFWFTPGGGVEPGEPILAAAKRELLEETGIHDAEFGPAVWYGEQALLLRGEPTLFRETFFIVRARSEALSDTGWMDDERASLKAMRWWTAAELREARELVLPSLLVDRASTLAALFEQARSAPEPTIERIALR